MSKQNKIGKILFAGALVIAAMHFSSARARAVTLSKLSATSIAFGYQKVGTASGARTVSLTNITTSRIAIWSVWASWSYAQTNNCGSSLAAAASCTIAVSFDPQQTGTISGKVVINAGGVYQTVYLSGTGVTSYPSTSPSGVVSLAPTSLSFGSVKVGYETAAKAALLHNGTTAALTVWSIATGSSYVQSNNCPGTLAAGASCTIYVSFKPLGAGTLDEQLVADVGSAKHAVSLAGSGYESTSSSGSGSVSGSRFYAPSSFWNTPITSTETTDPNSANIINKSILPYVSNANLTNSKAWGRSLATATSTSKVYTVACTLYGCGNTVTFPIPKGALPNTGSDHHLVVINPATNQELDMWRAAYNSTNDTWSAGSRVINDLYGWGACGLPGTHCNSIVAAGFAGMGGVVRPEEIQQGHIDHALSITLPYTRASYIACPATHTDGKYNDTSAIPEGARIQLDPSFDVSVQPWPEWEKIIAKALQTYGAYIADTGGTLAIYGQNDMNAGNLSWSSVSVSETGPSLSNLPWNRFRVLTIKSCN